MRWPASVFQRSVAQLDELMPGVMTQPTETMGITVRVRGPLDLDVLDRAFAELVARHELFRTRIVRDDASPDPGRATGQGSTDIWQEVVPPVGYGEPGGPRLARLAPGDERPVAGGPDWPIPPDEPPLVRAAVVQVDDREHLLGLTLHHVIADQASAALAMRDLALVYSARVRGAPPPPIPLQHGAYAVWQQRRLAERAERDGQAWARALEGLEPPRYRRTLPFKPGASGTLAWVRRPLLDLDECEAVGRWSQARHCTAFATFLAAFARVLADRTDARDLPVMSAFEQRDNPAIRNLPGPFLYPTLLRIPVVDGEPDLDLVCRVRDVVTATYSRAQVTMMDLAGWAPALLPGVLGLEPSWLRLFHYQPSDKVATTFRFGEALGRSVFDGGRTPSALVSGVQLYLRHDADGALLAQVGYDTSEHDEAAVVALLDDWTAAVRAIAGIGT
ncbi:MAG TPA: condensation domain-containing protein [Acidimicrobiales bacterium]